MTQGPQPICRCIVCGSETSDVIDLGRQPLANQLLEERDQSFDTFELGLAYCPSCSHGQLTHFVDPRVLFSHYLYASGTSGTLKSYFDWFAIELRRTLGQDARVLEVACNDGTLLAKLSEQGLDAVGVDPAENLTSIARQRGLDVLTGFFPQVAPSGKFDAVIAMNVLAHTPEPLGILQGIKKHLGEGGVAFVQTSQAMMLEDAQFDTIYHEHYSFFTPRSMETLSARVGLRLEKVFLTTVHGGSAVFVLRHIEDDSRTSSFTRSGGFLISADPAGVTDTNYPADPAGTYQRFAMKSHEIIAHARKELSSYRHEGKLIALTGVAAKSMTFIRAARIEPDVYLDEAALKVGRFIPGTDQKIKPFSAARDLPDDTVFLIGAWNFASEIIGKIEQLRPGRTSTAMTAFPALAAIEDKGICVAS